MFLTHFSEHRLLVVCAGVSYQENKKNAVSLNREIIFIAFMHAIYFLKELIENAIKQASVF